MIGPDPRAGGEQAWTGEVDAAARRAGGVGEGRARLIEHHARTGSTVDVDAAAVGCVVADYQHPLHGDRHIAAIRRPLLVPAVTRRSRSTTTAAPGWALLMRITGAAPPTTPAPLSCVRAPRVGVDVEQSGKPPARVTLWLSTTAACAVQFAAVPDSAARRQRADQSSDSKPSPKMCSASSRVGCRHQLSRVPSKTASSSMAVRRHSPAKGRPWKAASGWFGV
jgi:hypothetical protein